MFAEDLFLGVDVVGGVGLDEVVSGGSVEGQFVDELLVDVEGLRFVLTALPVLQIPGDVEVDDDGLRGVDGPSGVAPPARLVGADLGLGRELLEAAVAPEAIDAYYPVFS